jgi:hypothetical protein
MLLLFAAALPALFWDGAPATAPALREAGIQQIYVAPAAAAEWHIDGISAQPADLQSVARLLPPKVDYRADQASASRSPWVNLNAFRFLRQPEGRFYYETTGAQSALAAAEAFMFGSPALIKTDAAGLKPLAEMLGFLKTVDAVAQRVVADIGFIDDGTPVAGEVLNLLVRDNLLVKLIPAADRALKLNVKLGTKEFPAEDAKNPGAMAHIIRASLTDEKRSLRLYGSAVVVGRITGQGNAARLELINYDTAARKVNGLRVRVLGRYSKYKLAAVASPGLELLDFQPLADATEFTLPELKSFAVIDLSR